MVEAVVAIPLFLIVFACMLYVGKLYSEQQRTLREAKQQAWTFALGNCQGGSGAAQPDGDAASQLDSKGAGLPPSAQKYGGKANGDQLMQNWGTAVATVQGSVASGDFLGWTHQVSTTTRMQCNEKPQSGDVGGVLSYGWSLRKFW